jgi:hypothetical protein
MMKRNSLLVATQSLAFLSSFALLFPFALGCSSSSSPGSTPESDASTSDSGTPEAAPNTINEHGHIIDYNNMTALAGVTVTAAGLTTTTGADGKWSLAIPAGTPSRPKVTFPGYIDVNLPEEIATGENDRHDLPIPDVMTYQLGQYAQRGYDTTKAAVSVAIHLRSTCASQAGATLTVVSPSGASVEYFKNGFPSQSATSVSAGETAAVTVYNLTPGVDPVFQLSHPTCMQEAFPVTDGTVTFTGKVTLEAGNANSVLVMYLK